MYICKRRLSSPSENLRFDLVTSNGIYTYAYPYFKLAKKSLFLLLKDPEVRNKLESFSDFANDEGLWGAFEFSRNLLFNILSVVATLHCGLELSTQDPTFRLAVMTSLVKPLFRFIHTCYSFPSSESKSDKKYCNLHIYKFTTNRLCILLL